MKPILLLLAFLILAGAVPADGPVIDAMDSLAFQPPKEKGRAEVVPGKVGNAVRFSFDNDWRGIFFTRRLQPSPEWDRAAGLSFWVKGDGSDQLGGIEFIYDEDYAVRYDYAFPLRNREWTKVEVPWRDLVPVLPGPRAKPLDARAGNPPSKLSQLWVGRWWYWRDTPAHSFALDEIRLEPALTIDTKDYRPAGRPLRRTAERLRAGHPVTLVTMGDSLTDLRHWSNRETNWPAMLQKQLEGQSRSKVTIVNPAIGGTQLAQNLVLIPSWLQQAPTPDLVTVCFGGNDWEAGTRQAEFEWRCRDAVERIRRATKGKADVLLMTTIPNVAHWHTMDELGAAVRTAARETRAGLADTAAAFHREGARNPAHLFASDQVHLGAAGQEVVARTVAEAINGR